MLSHEDIEYLESHLSEKIQSHRPLSGGDINEVYLINTSAKAQYVVKANSASRFPGMFVAEASGLQKLQDTRTFTVPKVRQMGSQGDFSFLVISYIDSRTPIKNFWPVFGEQLARLHQTTQPYFGLDTHNYIGSLPQYNKKCTSAYSFYISQRLQPQFQLAIKNGFSFANLDTFYKNLESEIPNEPSSLVHGDLWSGNYMVDADGFPALIDPAIAYAPREMDIGMMHLFGGFDPKLFSRYQEIFPMSGNWKDRLPVWQLYYLLVHLNLFGSSYYNQAKNIVDRFS